MIILYGSKIVFPCVHGICFLHLYISASILYSFSIYYLHILKLQINLLLLLYLLLQYTVRPNGIKSVLISDRSNYSMNKRHNFI